MNRAIEKLKGIGPARAELFHEEGIYTVGDLLYRFPRRYIDRTISETTMLQTGQYITLILTVKNKFMAHGRKSRAMVNCTTPTGEQVTLVFFHSARYFLGLFESGHSLVCSGKLEYFRGMQMAHPDFEFLDEDDAHALLHVGRIVPVYPTGEALKKRGLDNRGLRRAMRNALDIPDLTIAEVLPSEIIAKYNYPDRRSALTGIHFPQSDQHLNASRQRLKYEELYLFQLMMKEKRNHREKIERSLWPLTSDRWSGWELFKKSLPFTLTSDQEKAIGEIISGCQVDHPSAFLLQGDVGSGKTAVALAVALHYIANRIQVAIMAPTEVLARQHFRTLSDICGLGSNVHMELLTGSDRKKQKELVLDGIRSGEVDLVVGTHALIDESVEFASLGLVIIDEQHRFGVDQREKLRLKGKNPDMMAMTATPIPRTLSLTEFGDLEMVVLKEKPAGRKPIKTMRLVETQRSGLYKSIRKHVSNGRQCYIVYPIIEESEKLDLRAASDAYEELSGIVFPDLQVSLLHGKLKTPEKEVIMRDFREGRVSILVTTTVVEVGVDVPNATIMVIEHADRFGISQLHQLRGRVGRGSEESFCILMESASLTDDAKDRLQAVVDSEDGFYLSEVDMKIRGPGQLLGLKQHGLDDFRLADLVHDRELTLEAHADAISATALLPEAIQAIRKRFAEGVMVFP